MKKKIIVTGGAGFIGGYVIDELIKTGRYEIYVADDMSKKESHITAVRQNSVTLVKIDLTDPIKTKELFKGADYCINLASKIGGIGYFHKHPATILSENNKIFSSTFEAAAENKLKRMIYVSSSMAFESSEIFPHKEKDLDKIPPPKTGYGFSKFTGEYYCRTFQEEFGLDYTIIRPFNVYGINEFPGDYVGYSHVIPDLTKKIISGQYPLEILGDGRQTRCFTHVKDIARAIVMALESEKAINEDFNIGSDEETEIIELAKNIWTIAGRKEDFKAVHLEPFTHDVKKRVPDISKAKEFLGWNPKISLDKGLPEVIEWLKNTL